MTAVTFGIAGLPRPSDAAAEAGAGERPVLFDIPAQPLATALERFMAASNIAVITDSTTVAGRTSATLQSRLPPDGALRSLLAGTGLDPRPIGASAYTLVLLPIITQARPLPRFVDYAAAIQQAVTSALCRREDTRPTHYRMVMRLWFSQAGAVTHVELGSSSGSPSRDRAIGDALQHIDIASSTPAGLPQPVKLAILPRPTNDAACSADGADGQPAPGR